MSDNDNPLEAIYERIEAGKVTKADCETVRDHLIDFVKFGKKELSLQAPELRKFLETIKTEAKKHEVTIPESKAVSKMIEQRERSTKRAEEQTHRRRNRGFESER